jgi:GntR family transcriptional regulator
VSSDGLNGRAAAAIDRTVPIPFYYQLRDILRNEIISGRLAVNQKLPSERELCERYGVSRPTVREAIEALVNEGLLRSEKGRGTFVTEPKIVEGLLETPSGFTDAMSAQGIPFTTRVLELALESASTLVARELHVAEGAPVVRLVRLRSIFDEPVLQVASFLLERFYVGLVAADLETVSLYHILRTEYGVTTARATRYMEAVAASREQAELLGVRPGDPLMLIESTTYTAEGLPFEYFRAQHRGDRTRFRVESFQTVVTDAGSRQPGEAL